MSTRTRAEVLADIVAVRTRRVSGVSSVQFSDRATSYSQTSLAETEAALLDELAQIDAAAAGRRRQHLGYAVKGF